LPIRHFICTALAVLSGEKNIIIGSLPLSFHEGFELAKQHRDHCIHIEIGNMHCQDIAFSLTFDTGLTSAEGQKLE
jgi:hypothetical protein